MSIKSSLLAENRALYLPAILETFARFTHGGSFSTPQAVAASELNFLDPANAFFYPFALYSAGQAAPTGESKPQPCMVTERKRSETIVVGDSGGFQIQTNVINFDRSATASRMLRWLEQTADWSMVLDFPTGGINAGQMRKHIADLKAEGIDLDRLSRANGLSVDYNACLEQTKINNDRFAKERAPGTRLLNVLQGRNERESKHWFDAVKHYEFDGWAFAGAHKDHFSLMVRRLVNMRDEGLLQRCKWIHVLGVGSLQIGCVLTSLQRAIRETTGTEVQFSFDASTPFVSAGKFRRIVLGHSLNKHSLSVQFERFSDFDRSQDDKLLIDVLCDRFAEKLRSNRAAFVARTFVAQRVRVGDLRSDGTELSTDGSYLLMHHNLEALLRAHSHAQQEFFTSDGMRADPVVAPFHSSTIAATIKTLFTGKTPKGEDIGCPYDRIDEWAPWMNDLAA